MTVFLCVIFVIVISFGIRQILDDTKAFEDGYEACYKAYHLKKSLLPYQCPNTPFEEGWNNALKELLLEQLI